MIKLLKRKIALFYFKHGNKRVLSIALMTIGSIVISFNGLVLRNIDVADNWTVIFFRAVSFSLAIFLFLLYKNRSRVFLKITEVGLPGLLAGMALGIANICFIMSMTMTKVANTVFTISLIPFITALLAFFILKENLSRITIFTMIGALLGVFIMLQSALDSGDLLGNFLALVTAISFSSFTLILRINKILDMLPCLILSGLIAIVVSSFYKMGSIGIPIKDLLLCFLLGGFMSAFVNCSFVFATRHLLAGEATLFFFIEISLSPIWVWLFANEEVAKNTLIGGLLILCSLLIRSFYLYTKSN